MEYKKCSIIISDFLDYLSGIKGASEKTIKEYRIDLSGFFNFIIKKRLNLKISHHEMDLESLKKISISDMYAYIRYLDKERLNGHNARARKISSLRTFYNYLTDKIKVIDKNIASELETPKIPKRNPIYLDLDESKNILSNIKSRRFYSRDYCIISIFLNCALRLSELVSINLGDIDWRNNSLSIIGKGNKERVIYLNEMV
ncbi:Tyrosine recombinase XerC, partial [Candidatus Arthromitus sp. SFB-1]